MNRKIVIDEGEEVLNRMERNALSLEDVIIQDESKYGQYVLAIIGKIRVANLAFAKTVFARVTFNNWASYRDYSGAHTETTKDGTSDIFAFGFTRRDKRPIYVEFALSCIQNGRQYWDSNNGRNYCFHLSEDPFKDPGPDENGEPQIVTTWRVAEESSPSQQGEEVIFDTSSYPHFQAHPLTPTKIKYYVSLNAAPEKEIIPTRVQDSKHVRAFNALAIENLLIMEEKPSHNESEEIEACTADVEECAITITTVETEECVDGQQTTISQQHIIVTEDPIEALKVEKPVDEQTNDEILDKLEKEQGITVDIQITEEPGDDNVNEGEINGTDELVADEQNAVDSNQEQAKYVNILAGKEENKAKPDVEPKKKKDKKQKKKSKKDTQEQKSGSEQEQKEESDLQNRDDRSLSSKKERIEDEDTPKKRKKGFLSRMACCGKAEPD